MVSSYHIRRGKGKEVQYNAERAEQRHNQCRQIRSPLRVLTDQYLILKGHEENSSANLAVWWFCND